MKGGVIAVIAILAIFQLAAVQKGEAVTCGEVDVSLMPCVNFLIGKDSSPPPACCAGVKAVKGMAQSTADKRACCSCVKAAAIRYTDLKDEAAQSLPTRCSVQLDIPISRTVDCNSIN